jgi:hypothetical protein
LARNAFHRAPFHPVHDSIQLWAVQWPVVPVSLGFRHDRSDLGCQVNPVLLHRASIFYATLTHSGDPDFDELLPPGYNDQFM